MQRQKPLPLEIHQQINDLYWNEGYFQWELAKTFKKDQGHISRILAGKVMSLEEMMGKKLIRLKQHIKPDPDEPKQARALRSWQRNSGNAKLTLSEVKRIREQYFFGGKTQPDIAKHYSVNQSTICRIIRGDKWKDIK